MSSFLEQSKGTMKEHLKTVNTKGGDIPETVVGAEGSAKRNIVRKNHKGSGGGSGGGKSKGNLIDDGSTYNDPYAYDENDPNYDSEEETGREYIPGDPNKKFEYVPEERLYSKPVIAAPMTLTSFKKKIEILIEELFRSGDIDETIRSIFELECPQFGYELVKRAISMSFDHTDKERELISKFISCSYPDLLSTNMIGKGFERIFELMDELEKDVPNTRQYIAIYLSRCVIDEVLPPSFLADIVVCQLGGDVVDHAKKMLSREHSHAVLEKGWGPGDGRPVEELKVTVDLIMQEYLLSKDAVEADRCIRELNSNLFHHEIVKRGTVISFEKSEEDRASMMSLFQYLRSVDTISEQQFVKGFDRLNEIVNELKLDIPNAPLFLQQFRESAISNGYLPSNYKYDGH